MPIYSRLAESLFELQGTPPATCPQGAVPGAWIPAAIDSWTRSETDDLPVLVAFGANYATGPGQLPQSQDVGERTTPECIEAPLNQWRQQAMRHLHRCAAGQVKPHWNGLLPYDTADSSQPTEALNLLGDRFHFVMTNATPWISQQAWSPLRDTNIEEMFGLLSDTGMQPSYWGYFERLKKTMGKRVVWIGHGNAEIYGLFRILCNRLNLTAPWFFDSNLSFPSQMEKR